MEALSVQAQKLAIEQTTVNVGKTGYRVPVTATFQLKNKGGRHLHIYNVKGDCGCTQVEFPHKSIGGGETFTITMTYDARMLGHFSKQAIVLSNGTKEPLCLTMEGVVLTEVKDFSKQYPFAFGNLLADTDNIEFDNVNKGGHPEVVINVMNNGDKTMRPNVLHLPSYLTALATPEELAPGQAGKLTLTLNSQYLHDFGLTQTSVYLAENLGEKVNNDIELPVSVVLLPNTTLYDGTNMQYAPKMQLSTDSLTLGMIGGKMQKKGVISITNTGRTTLNISSLQLFTKGIKVTLDKRELQPQQTAKLKIAIADRDYLLKSRRIPRVLMITNDPTLSKVVIKVAVK